MNIKLNQYIRVGKLIETYINKHPMALSCGSEYIMQDDKAQEDALGLVCEFFDIIIEDELNKEGKINK